jgi:quercetin dioxygenase-like cupin family protein
MSSATTTRPAQAPVLQELEQVTFTVGDDETAEARLAMPISAETRSPHTVVYLEVDPGKRIPLHTHTADEIFVVLQGTGVVIAGDQRWEAGPGAFAVAPAFVPHSWENTGTDTLRLVGFLGSNVLIHEFEAPVTPFGVATFATPLLSGPAD